MDENCDCTARRNKARNSREVKNYTRININYWSTFGWISEWNNGVFRELNTVLTSSYRYCMRIIGTYKAFVIYNRDHKRQWLSNIALVSISNWFIGSYNRPRRNRGDMKFSRDKKNYLIRALITVKLNFWFFWIRSTQMMSNYRFYRRRDIWYLYSAIDRRPICMHRRISFSSDSRQSIRWLILKAISLSLATSQLLPIRAE